MKALIAAFADPNRSPRPRRMLEACLEQGFETHLFSLPADNHLGAKRHFPVTNSLGNWPTRRKIAAVKMGLLYHIQRSQKGRESMIESSYHLDRVADPFAAHEYDVIIVEDLFLLPYCLKRRKHAHIIFDAREFYPKQREGEILFSLLEAPIRDWVCTTYLKECDKVFTVSNGLAEEYKRVYGIDAQILMSTPKLQPELAKAKPNRCEKKLRLVHLGGANPNRRLENMIRVFAKLDSRFTFDLFLTGSARYIRRLKKIAEPYKNIHIQDPVGPNEIISSLSDYDIGFYYLEPKGFNLKHSLPNKLFEFIHAGLAVAIGPSPEMSRLVNRYQCGFVSEDFSIDAMASTLNAIDTDSVNKAKENSKKAAKQLCAEFEWEKVKACLCDLANR
ncbi:MAG: glycosyltransferase [Verrucomicrobiota bacterium]